MYGVVKESAINMSMACQVIQFRDRELTRQIGPLDQVGSYDAHQAGHANQAAQSEDARQHELLTCFKLQPPNHVQGHTQNNNIKCHVRRSNCPVIRLQIYALAGESVLRVPHARERLALKYEAEDCSYSPCNACHADDPRGLLECLGVEDPAIHQQDGDFDHQDCECVSDKGGGDSLTSLLVEFYNQGINHRMLYL